MKKIILLSIIVFSINTYSQSNDNIFRIKESDFSFSDGKARIKEKSFNIFCINNKFHTFVFTAFIKDEKFKEIGVDGISKIISDSNKRVPYTLKNKYTYSPISIRIDYYDNENHWVVLLDYTAQNDYGATKDGSVIIHYSSNGEFISLVNI